MVFIVQFFILLMKNAENSLNKIESEFQRNCHLSINGIASIFIVHNENILALNVLSQANLT